MGIYERPSESARPELPLYVTEGDLGPDDIDTMVAMAFEDPARLSDRDWAVVHKAHPDYFMDGGEA